jgi:hypothetical protein
MTPHEVPFVKPPNFFIYFCINFLLLLLLLLLLLFCILTIIGNRVHMYALYFN